MQNPTHQKDHATKVDHGKQHGSKKNSWHQSMFRGVCNGLMELTDWRNFDGKLTESNPSRHTSRQPKSNDVTFSHPCWLQENCSLKLPKMIPLWHNNVWVPILLTPFSLGSKLLMSRTLRSDSQYSYMYVWFSDTSRKVFNPMYMFIEYSNIFIYHSNFNLLRYKIFELIQFVLTFLS